MAHIQKWVSLDLAPVFFDVYLIFKFGQLQLEQFKIQTSPALAPPLPLIWLFCFLLIFPKRPVAFGGGSCSQRPEFSQLLGVHDSGIFNFLFDSFVMSAKKLPIRGS